MKKHLRNRAITGCACILLGLAVGFLAVPSAQRGSETTVHVIRAAQTIEEGSHIEDSMLEGADVTASQVNLTDSSRDMFAGQYAVSRIYKGDYLTPSKVTSVPADMLSAATAAGKVIMSVTVKNLATSASGIIQSGDVVMLMVSGVDPEKYTRKETVEIKTAETGPVIRYDPQTSRFYYSDDSENTRATTSTSFDAKSINIIDSVRYLEVASVSASDGSASVVNPETAEGEANSLPSTISFFCTEEQALILAQIELTGGFQVAFVARGSDADPFLPASERVLSDRGAGTAGTFVRSGTDPSVTVPAARQTIETRQPDSSGNGSGLSVFDREGGIGE